MVLQDKNTYRQIIGSLMKQPNLFDKYDDISIEDFGSRMVRTIYTILQKVRSEMGDTPMDYILVDMKLSDNEAAYASYQKDNGLQFLKDSYDFSQVEAFDYYYNRLKKLSLLNKLKRNGYNIEHYFKDNCETVQEEEELIERLDNSSVEDILDYIEGQFNQLKSNFLSKHKNGGTAATGIQELITELERVPEVGVALEGNLYSNANRGARLGKFYLRSGSSGTGKSRLSVFDSCKVAFPKRWNHDLEDFIVEKDMDGNDREPQKTLMITTEMDRDEIRTIMLAYLSGVNETKILTGKYDSNEERQRVRYAGRIIEEYRDYYFLEEISDPNLTNVEALIRRYANVEKIEYCFYDYIFSSPSLIAQFQEAKVREDVALGMLSNQLKQIAKDYNIFIMSSTQVNASGMGKEIGFKDETCLRGAKSIADKIDSGCVISRVSYEEYDEFDRKLKEAASRGEVVYNGTKPTHVIDIYKMRRGQYKNVRIWCELNLGTGYRKDLYMTRIDNTPYPDGTIVQAYESCKEYIIGNWKENLVEVGI